MAEYCKKICVIGLGYIGLPTASLLGTKGYNVLGVDISKKIVNTINQGKIHIIEPDLDILVKSAVMGGNLTANHRPREADVFIIAVPTPFKGEKTPDLSYIESATQSISPFIKPGNLVILESTSPVGTTDEVVVETLKRNGHDVNNTVYVAHCPERVLPGRILIELIENDRVVGGINPESTKRAVEFYNEFVTGDVIGTNAKTAEMVKLAENASRDVSIAYANELSMICESENISTWEVIELANRHPRVNILQPGPGVGGHCIAVDPWFIIDRSPDFSTLIKAARAVNDLKPAWVIDRVKRQAEKFKKPIIGCLGITFKSDIDDLRQSPALNIVYQLQEQNVGKLMVCEPNLNGHREFTLFNLEETIENSDIVLLLVDHKQFRRLKASDMNEKVLIDTRGIVK